MLDPPAPIALVSRLKLGIGVERLRIGGIADRVDRDLITVERRAAHNVAQLGILHELEPAIVRAVAIRRLEPRPARAKRAVCIELDPAHPQPIPIEPRRRRIGPDDEDRIEPGRIGKDADVEPAAIARATETRPILDSRAHIGNASNAEAEQCLLRLEQRLIPLTRKRLGHGFLNQHLRRIDENAGRLARHHLDPPAGWRNTLRRHPGLGHRRAVRPSGMAIHPLEPDRLVPHHSIEFSRGRKTAQPPKLLIPAAPDDPFSAAMIARIGRDLRLRLGEGSRASKIERQRLKPQRHDMPMRIDQPRQHRPPLAVDPVIGPIGGGDGFAFFGFLRRFGRRRGRRDEPQHLPVIAHHQPAEPHHLPRRIEGDAIHIVDQRIGICGRGEEEGESGESLAQIA